MWQQLKTQDSNFLIKKVNVDGNHVIFVSNLMKMWVEELTAETIYQRCKKLNPLLEGQQESLTSWILSLLDEDTTANIIIRECDDSRVLEIKSKLSRIPFVFKFYLELVTFEKFYKEMTLPLVLMIQQLQNQKVKLFDLLRRKDVEISDYKMEGAQLSRKNIETAKFIENQFEESYSTIGLPIDIVEKPTLIFRNEIQMLYRDVLHKYENALNEAAKEETDTEDSGTQSALNDSSPEKKKKQGTSSQPAATIQTQSEKMKDENKETKKQEENLLYRQKKQAMKRKLLPL